VIPFLAAPQNLTQDLLLSKAFPLLTLVLRACGLDNSALTCLAPLVTYRPNLEMLDMSENHISYSGGYTLLCSLNARYNPDTAQLGISPYSYLDPENPSSPRARSPARDEAAPHEEPELIERKSMRGPIDVKVAKAPEKKEPERVKVILQATPLSWGGVKAPTKAKGGLGVRRLLPLQVHPGPADAYIQADKRWCFSAGRVEQLLEELRGLDVVVD
jgi:hypothetical protein